MSEDTSQFDLEARIRQSLKVVMEEVRVAVGALRNSMVKASDDLEKTLDIDWDTFIPFEKVWELQERAREKAESSPLAAAVEPEPIAPPDREAQSVPDLLPALKDGVLALERGKTQVEVLTTYLAVALAYCSRVVIFILKGDRATGWKGAGHEDESGEWVKALNFDLRADNPIAKMLREERTVTMRREDRNPIAEQLDGPSTRTAAVIPMLIKDKIAAGIYADWLPEEGKQFSVHGLELLTFFTGLTIDTLGQRQKIPSPTLTSCERLAAMESGGAASPEPAGRPETELDLAEAPQPAATMMFTPPKRETVAPLAARQSVQMTPEMGTMMAPAAAPRPVAPPPPPPPPRPVAPPPPPRASVEMTPEMGTMMAPAVSPRPVPAVPRPQVPDIPPPTGASLAGGEEVSLTMAIPTTVVKPPASAGAGRWGSVRDGALSDENAKAHDEARRFARLLASEIKLYNEAKVEQGKRNKDLYERLKEDIDRSRQMYEERIAETVRGSSNYFYDELVRILADGDKAALGL